MSEHSEKEICISWDEAGQDCRFLADKLKHRTWKGLIAVTRGGMVPAALLSRALGILRIETLCVHSYDDRSLRTPRVVKEAETGDAGKDWLVVDDLADTGTTLALVRNMLPEAHVATLYVKPAGRAATDTTVREYAQDIWIVFPWEV